MGIFPNASVLRVSYGIQLLFILFAESSIFLAKKFQRKETAVATSFAMIWNSDVLSASSFSNSFVMPIVISRPTTPIADKAIPEKLDQRILGIPDKQLFQFSFFQISRTSFSASFMLILL
jgi:hypothetical protein